MNTALTKYDLAIVGASFAGLVCARTAAMRGLRVAVIDVKTDPGQRVHTSGILVKEALDQLDVPDTLTRKIRGVRLYAPNLSSVDLFAPGYFFLATDTANLLRWLARDAEAAGADIIGGCRITRANEAGPFIDLPDARLRARFVVGADGPRSEIARLFGLSKSRSFLYGVEWDYESIDGVDGRFLHCFLNQELAPGYIGWVVPGVGATQIGLAARAPARPSLSRMFERVAPLFGVARRKVIGRRSGLIPVNGRLRRTASPRVMLIGDAAGWVSPLTGGGIRFSLQYGRRAGQLIADHLGDYGGDPAAQLAAELPGFAGKAALRWAFEHTPHWMFNNALMTRPMLSLAQRIYFHRRGTAGSHFDHYKESLVRRDDATRGAPR